MKIITTIKAWKRPYYLKEVLNSLEATFDADKQHIYISIDQSPATKKETLEVINSYKYPSTIQPVFHASKLGCAGNMRNCFEYVFDKKEADAMIHLEDDTPVGIDIFKWSTWAYNYMKNKDLFAACLFTRKCAEGEGTGKDPFDNIIKDHFDCGGGYLITREQYNYIRSIKPIFGIVGPASTEAEPDSWLRLQHITDDGSWAWPFNRYYRRGKLCLYPLVNRTNNIGAKDGRFNPSLDWHKDNILVKDWIRKEHFENIDINNINYKIPNENRDKRYINLKNWHAQELERITNV